MKSKREQILEVSMQLFRHKGYASTSMQDIATELDMKAASLYNHISSKQEMLVELLVEGAQLFTEGMVQVKSSSLDALEKIEKLILFHVRLSVERTDLMALMAVEWRHLEGQGSDNYRQMRDEYEAEFKELLEQAIADRQLMSVDVDLALFTILTTLQRFYAWYDRHSEHNLFDLEKYLIQCLLGGLRR